MTKRAAVYIRVSSQRQEKGASLRTQEEIARRYCAERGYEVVTIFRDVHTGEELYEREGMTALLAAVRAREIDVVIAHALDRLGRSQQHLGLIFSECDHRQVAVELSTESLDDTPEGKLLQAVRGYAAEVERL